MTTKLNFGRDVQGYNSYAPRVSNSIQTIALTSNVDTTITTPKDSNIFEAIFEPSAGATIYVALNTAAAVPSSSSAASTSSECNPASRVCNPGDVWHFITADVGSAITVAFYDISSS